MTQDRLQRYMLISLVLHVIFFSAFIIQAKRSNLFNMPSPYVVSLVSLDRPSRGHSSGAVSKPAAKPAQKKETPKAATAPAPTPSKTARPAEKAEPAPPSDTYVTDRIALLKAKQKIREIVKMREAISLGASGGPDTGKEAEAAPPSGGAQGQEMDPVMQRYLLSVKNAIWQEWVYTGADDSGLEAVIIIQIKNDGTIVIKETEHSSGNRRFDNSALEALKKASPVPPPPYEIEFGVRFHP